MISKIKNDLPAALVVFLVALPLCLGIALASGAPLFSGLISGIIGGIVVGLISGSNTSVSGPAACLTAVVLAAITQLGSFDVFLTAYSYCRGLSAWPWSAQSGLYSRLYSFEYHQGSPRCHWYYSHSKTSAACSWF